ncbi:MAG TPA: oligopeptide transporter, OPT family [Croceibacterium sp.]|nr:oligopeptide transporter, OPT family [Croceibacterium sp.]
MGSKELTIRGIVLGGLLTVLFTAANVYLGLKIGITFATSIPAAVISMAVLRFFAGATIQENNIVQTLASAAGTLAAIIFVLPGLVMVGWWTGFPYWQSVAIIAIGGILGVMYSVPLRRALVTGSDLPYPEGLAAAEVLKVGAGVGGAEENRKGLVAIVIGSLVSTGYALLAKMKLVVEETGFTAKIGAGATNLGTSYSMALIGVGHLVGMAVGIAMLVGLVTARFVLLPWYTAGGAPAGTGLGDFVDAMFVQNVRFVGAGTIGIAAIWTLFKLIVPITRGIAGALAAARVRKAGQGDKLDITEQDLPIGLIGAAILLSLIPIGFLLASFASGGVIEDHLVVTLAAAMIYVLVIGVVIASVTGYMAGLIGASNSPVSGVGILAALGISLVLLAIFGRGTNPEDTRVLVAFALFVTALVFSIATISNDNLQDLKTGQLVGATPWRQQVALIIGVIFGSLVIPPILDLLNTTFGFVGTPGAGPDALAAPQAALISAIAQGVLGGDLNWNLIGLGVLIGAVVIALDEGLARTRKYSLPPLAVGMGIYLPMSLTLLVTVGALIGWLYNRWARSQADPAFAERMGVLVATGLIVGESLFGVAFAGIAAATGSASPLAVMGEGPFTVPVGTVVFIGAVGWCYWRTRKMASSRAAGAMPDPAASSGTGETTVR